jgi:hypothetical protein
MNMDNYPHVTITADGSLCSTGQHRPGFPRVLYDALRQLGYEGDAPVYRGRISMAHGQDKCEVNVVIPLKPMEPWMATVIGVKLDETIEQMAQVALTSLCETRLARHRCDANRALSDPQPRGSHVEAAPSGCVQPRGASLPRWHGCIGWVCAAHV